MQTYPTWAYAMIGVLLIADGVLLGLHESSYLLPLPFLLAAYLYFTPASLRGGRIVAIATLGIIALSLVLGLSYVTTGLSESSMTLATGLVVVGLDSAVIALVFLVFFKKRVLA